MFTTRSWIQPILGAALALLAGAAPALAYDADCHLNYPIVLSHHWSVQEICPRTSPASGPAACVNAQDYDKYCVAKSQDANGNRVCGDWRITAAEADLPPRDVNATDPTLTRDASKLHRYFSADIVSRLRDACGNKVYLADKPPYASYEVRARSLRNTVLQALAAEHAQKVIVIGVSQGVQDARYMAARLPVSDVAPQLGPMKDKVAAIVSLVGEDGGTESASIALNLLYLIDGGNWADRGKIGSLWSESDFDAGAWRKTVNGQTTFVLSEQCRPGECNLSLDQKFAWSVRSLYDLSTRHMRPDWLQRALNTSPDWLSLKAFVGATEDSWQDVIPPAAEANNGIQYFHYGAKLHSWYASLGDASSQEFLIYSAIVASAGENDGYVSPGRQRWANAAPNFHNMKTLDGPLWGRGYHHMFFTGRNEALYAPPPGSREAAPYGGTSADFYQQVARDLKAYGF